MVVIKKNTKGKETWRYTGNILYQGVHSILLEARFNREDLAFHDIVLGKNDRFVEAYFNNRWFNIYEIHDREDDYLKAWYCNITYPAEFSKDAIAYIDLALDLLVYPNGEYLILDEDEFEALDLRPQTRKKARFALEELKQIFVPIFEFNLEQIVKSL